MSTDDFFEESTEQSIVKATIVSKYFLAWATVMVPKQKSIAYIDLFAGPGRYADGSRSTPLLILEKAIRDEKIRNRLGIIFNDKDENNTHSLQNAIDEITGIDDLRYKPVVLHSEVDDNIVDKFEEINFVPTFFFIDPFGYKGLSLRLLKSVLKDWGCDCVFFFNYNRINMGIHNPIVEQHMECLFGKGSIPLLRSRLAPLDANEREKIIVEELCSAIKTMGPQFTLPFRFRDDKDSRTTHHLIFVSKNFLGYHIMKDIMANVSSTKEQGVASFEYNPAKQRQLSLFEFSQPLDDLQNLLLKAFSGKRLRVKNIYEKHSIDRPYTERNYKKALLELEKRRKITISEHRAGQLGDDVMVTFP